MINRIIGPKSSATVKSRSLDNMFLYNYKRDIANALAYNSSSNHCVS